MLTSMLVFFTSPAKRKRFPTDLDTVGNGKKKREKETIGKFQKIRYKFALYMDAIDAFPRNLAHKICSPAPHKERI